MKMTKLKHCILCKYNKFYPKIDLPDNDEMKFWLDATSRFKCTNTKSKRKNSNYRIIHKKIIVNGEIPKWCLLEDHLGEVE